MRCIPRLFAFVCLALVCAVPAYSAQFLFETVRVNPATGTVLGPGMDGPSEPQPSLGTGYGTALYDDVAHTLTLDAIFYGPDGHHDGLPHSRADRSTRFRQTAGVATTTPSFAGFPLMALRAARMSHVLDLTLASSWNPSYITANGGITGGRRSRICHRARGQQVLLEHSFEYIWLAAKSAAS